MAFRSEFLGRVVKAEMSSFQLCFISDFPWSKSLGEVSVMIRRAESCAARASFRASSKEERRFSRAGRNVFPSGG